MPGGHPSHYGNKSGRKYLQKHARNKTDPNFLAGHNGKATDNGRLYVRGAVMAYKGGLRTQYAHTSILKLENVADTLENFDGKCAKILGILMVQTSRETL